MKTSLSAYINLKKERERSSVNRSQNLNMCVTINGGEIVGISFILIESMTCVYLVWMVCNLHLQQHRS
ncbi:hypothetical protein TE101_14230 [Alteromonas macleodii]|nr:hypothetical protein TE101_14230 [Alteromonas macleodii]